MFFQFAEGIGDFFETVRGLFSVDVERLPGNGQDAISWPEIYTHVLFLQTYNPVLIRGFQMNAAIITPIIFYRSC